PQRHSPLDAVGGAQGVPPVAELQLDLHVVRVVLLQTSDVPVLPPLRAVSVRRDPAVRDPRPRRLLAHRHALPLSLVSLCETGAHIERSLTNLLVTLAFLSLSLFLSLPYL